jgi:hypothetical protein
LRSLGWARPVSPTLAAHCFFSGPILLVGALLAALIALGLLDAIAISLGAIVTGALVLFGLTYALELAWGRYLRRDA